MGKVIDDLRKRIEGLGQQQKYFYDFRILYENIHQFSVIDTFPQILVLPPNIYDKSTPMVRPSSVCTSIRLPSDNYRVGNFSKSLVHSCLI